MPDWNTEVRAALEQLRLDAGREESICEELACHLNEKYRELIANGVSETDAHALTMQSLSEEKLREHLSELFHPEPSSRHSEWSGSGFFTGFHKDVRLALRQLRLDASFAAVAILSLALGIGANAAIFALIDAVLLRTLPVPNPQTLAEVRIVHQNRLGNSVSRQNEFSSALWTELQRRQEGFASLAAWSTERFDLGRGSESRRVDGLWASGSFFETLHVRPALGRFFSEPDDARPCPSAGTVISYAFWRGEYGGDPGVLGRALALNGERFPIIGVAAPAFSGIEVGHKFDVALPLCAEPTVHPEDRWSSNNTTWWLDVIGRLKPGWSVGRASGQLSAISAGVFRSTLPARYDPLIRDHYLHFRLRAVPAATGVSEFRNSYSRPLLVLLAISGVVLLIACFNVANLMLARAAGRQRELALRFAIGASRFRVVRQLFIESLLISVIGAGLGAALAQAVTAGLVARIGTADNQVYLAVGVDWRFLLFTAGLAIAACMVFGMAPAFRAAKIDPGSAIRAGGRGTTSNRHALNLRRGFTVLQVALSMALVVIALLFVRTFRNLAEVDAGFQPDGVLVAAFDFSRMHVPVRSRLEYKRNLLEQVRDIPGVLSAARTNIVPMSGNGWNEFVDVPNTPVQRKLANFSAVTSDYFRTLDIPLNTGRDFNDSDTPDSPPVAIVNEAFAKVVFGALNIVGRTFGVKQDAGKPDKIYEVIGVVGNTRYTDLREHYGPIAFIADSQDDAPDAYATVLIRSSQDFPPLTSALRTMAERSSADMVVYFSSLRQTIRNGLGRERLIAALSGFYGGLAVLLSMVGLYGVMSYTVVRRTFEIGVRVALGAGKIRVLAIIGGDVLLMTGAGVAFGLMLIVAVSAALKAMLYGVSPTDPQTLLCAIGGVTIVALLAGLAPARRAANIDPMRALRHD